MPPTRRLASIPLTLIALLSMVATTGATCEGTERGKDTGTEPALESGACLQKITLSGTTRVDLREPSRTRARWTGQETFDTWRYDLRTRDYVHQGTAYWDTTGNVTSPHRTLFRGETVRFGITSTWSDRNELSPGPDSEDTSYTWHKKRDLIMAPREVLSVEGSLNHAMTTTILDRDSDKDGERFILEYQETWYLNESNESCIPGAEDTSTPETDTGEDSTPDDTGEDSGEDSGDDTGTGTSAGEIQWPVTWGSDTASTDDLVGYGLRWLEYYDYGGTCGPTQHPGLDFNYGSGTDDAGLDAMAIGHGTVVYSDWCGGYGNTIIVEHTLESGEQYWALYAHLSERSVSSGSVEAGDVVGLIGNSGTTSPHLHFEIRASGLDIITACDFPCGESLEYVQTHYRDPQAFIIEH